MRVNVTSLDQSLQIAGVPIHGCSSDGRIDFKAEATAEQRILAAAILAAHDPSPTYVELREREYPLTSELVIALWERAVEGRPEAANLLQARRAAIKLKYPKPGVA